MSSRKLNDFITGYLKYVENTEPPKSFHTWTALSMIAGCLQRKAYILWGHEIIYPNMYVVLVAKSGKCRKGTTMSIGRDILKEIGIPITSESITREALIRFMKNKPQNYQDPDGAIKFHCSITCLSEELSVFLGQNDVKFLADLTDWYDSRDEWTYETKQSGTDHIQGVCFNLLGATAPDWLQSILPQEAVGGGFTSRIIFIVEERKYKVVPEHELTNDEKQLRELLVDDLKSISTLAGHYTFNPDAKQKYSDFYIKQEREAQAGIVPIDDPRLAGYCDRRATHIRKLCMLMSASRTNDMTINISDFDRALNVLTTCEVNMHKTFGGLGRSQYSEAVELILDYLIVRKKCTKSELLKKFYRDIDPQSLKIAEEVLTGMKVMKINIDMGGKNETRYEYIGPE